MKTSSRASPISPSSCVEQLARAADERDALLVLVAPGASPTKMRSGVGVARAEDDLCPGLRELRAARAGARLVEDAP